LEKSLKIGVKIPFISILKLEIWFSSFLSKKVSKLCHKIGYKRALYVNSIGINRNSIGTKGRSQDLAFIDRNSIEIGI